jgi:hypothetical protein
MNFKKPQETIKNDWFFSFGWVLAQQTSKSEFLRSCRFFWYSFDSWKRTSSGDILIFRLKCQIFQQQRHLTHFFISFRIKPDVTSIGFTNKNRIFTTFWYQSCKNCKVVLPIRIWIWMKYSCNLLMCAGVVATAAPPVQRRLLAANRNSIHPSFYMYIVCI